MPKKKKEPLTLQAYNLLKEKIITLEFAPGQHLDERRLVEEFDLGRTPIREALLKLEVENLVESSSGKGTYVKQITLKGVKDLLEALLSVERSAAQLAVINITPEQISEIKSINKQIDEAIRKGDSLNLTYHNGQFHRLIAKASNNEYLYTFINKIRVEEQRLAYLCFSKENLVNYPLKEHFQLVSRQHANIITFLEKRDPKRLDEELVDHNKLFRRRIFGYQESHLSGESSKRLPFRERSSH
jgi:DNA-binding GntR family transcriptional regulator